MAGRARFLSIAAVALFFAAAATSVGPDAAARSSLVEEITKAGFLERLDTEQTMLVAVYERGDAQSESVLSEIEEFAALAAAHYPDLHVSKVDHRDSPYLTARLLLTEIPELRLLVRDKDDQWAAYKIDTDDGSEPVAEFVASRRWESREPVGGSAQMFCSPFNLCGRAMGAFAEYSSAFDAAVPIPRWLALIVIPALITLAGRFIIEAMYAADMYVRSAIGAQPAPATAADKKRQ
ncbi:hypothetical protein H4R18_001325 [Coemansia javaensis]|uniref:Uncharacterized protein n=1 Tax=Coemansia javaensis TaxID=2761396 RepID=A0A9W8LLR4_9FUNG|nr:hypothetical protein H4R18_001325 [Coemansia javaensis]